MLCVFGCFLKSSPSTNAISHLDSVWKSFFYHVILRSNVREVSSNCSLQFWINCLRSGLYSFNLGNLNGDIMKIGNFDALKILFTLNLCNMVIGRFPNAPDGSDAVHHTILFWIFKPQYHWTQSSDLTSQGDFKNQQGKGYHSRAQKHHVWIYLYPQKSTRAHALINVQIRNN